MAHSKEYMVKHCQQMLEAMEPALKVANVRPNLIVVHPEAVELRADFIRPGHKWLVVIFETVYEEYRLVRSLLTEEQWQRYMLWEDFDDHREVVMLKAAAEKLRKAISSTQRPDFFKKGKVNAKIKKLQGQGSGSKAKKKEPVEHGGKGS